MSTGRIAMAEIVGSDPWLNAIRLVLLASPLKVKQSVVISALVVVLSAVAHSLVLWMPMPATRQPAAPSTAESEPADLSVVVLPQSEAPSAPPPPEPPQPPAPPSAAPIAPPPAPALLPTDVIPESPPPAPPAPAAPTAAPPPDDLPIADGAAESAFVPPPNDGPLSSYGDRFPHFEGAVGGCFGLSECRQVSGVGSYRTVARSLIAGLESQGYRVKLRDDLEDTGRNVYELTPPGNDPPQQFLMVFSGTDGSAIYVMSPEIMTLEELQALAAQRESNRLSV